MAMTKLTEHDVYQMEHRVIENCGLWDCFDDDRSCHSMLAYISGIHDMASTIIRQMKDE